MLKQIADALQSYNTTGIAVIVGSDGNDPREIADHVLPVLKSLKCSFDSYYNGLEHSFFIVDNIGEIILGEVISKCSCCKKMSTQGGMIDAAILDADIQGLVCSECLPRLLPSKIDHGYIETLISVANDYLMISADVIEEDVKDHILNAIANVKDVYLP